MPTLLLFTKLPESGRVKTRLVPPLTGREATRVYRAFLDDQLARLRRLAPLARPEVCIAGPPGPAGGRGVDGVGGLEGIDTTFQGDGGLGARLERAFARLHASGRGPVVVIATDAPLLADASIRSAFAALAYGRDCVVTAADDGGYVLLGTRAHRPALFRDVDWGGPSVLAATRDRAARLGLDAEWPAPGRDVDDASDLRRLRVALRSPHRRERLPATAAALDSLSTTVI